jgi:hypothetical protein
MRELKSSQTVAVVAGSQAGHQARQRFVDLCPARFPRDEIEPAYAELRNAERLLGLQLHIVRQLTPIKFRPA